MYCQKYKLKDRSHGSLSYADNNGNEDVSDDKEIDALTNPVLRLWHRCYLLDRNTEGLIDSTGCVNNAK